MKLYCHVVIATEQHKDQKLQVIVIGLGYDVMHSMCLTINVSHFMIMGEFIQQDFENCFCPCGLQLGGALIIVDLLVINGYKRYMYCIVYLLLRGA